MGFDSKDFDRVKRELLEEYTRKEKLYQQAGNSIVVNILEVYLGIYMKMRWGDKMKNLGTNIRAYVDYYEKNLSKSKYISIKEMADGKTSTKRQRIEVLLTLGIIKKLDSNYIDTKKKIETMEFLNDGLSEFKILNILNDKFNAYRNYITAVVNREECDYFDYKDEHLLVEGIMIALLYDNGWKEQIEKIYLKNNSSQINVIKLYNLKIEDSDLVKLASKIIFPNKCENDQVIMKDAVENFEFIIREPKSEFINSEVYTFGLFIKNFLKNDNCLIKIPVYQREYLWTTEKTMNLFYNIFQDEVINLNSVTFNETKISQRNTNLIVIDGQQRITTLLTMLRAIYDASYELISIRTNNFQNGSVNTEEYEIKQLNSIYKYMEKEFFALISDSANRNLILKNYIRVEGDNTFEDFEDTMNGNNPRFDKSYTKHVHENYTILKKHVVEKVNSSQEIEKLIDKILNSVYLTVTIDSKTNELKLFETLNTTGIPLTTLDLMKCNLLSLVKPEVLLKNETAIQQEFTEKISNKIGKKNSDIEKFIRVYLRYYDKVSKNMTLFENFKTTIKSNEGELELNDIKNEFIKIEKIVDIYNYINGNSEKVNSNDFSKYMLYDFTKTLDRDIYYPILIHFFNELSEEKMTVNEVRKILLELEKFEIIFQVCNYRGQSLSDKMDHILREIRHETKIDEVKTKEILLNEEIFKNSLKINKNVFIDQVKKFDFSENLSKKLLIRIVNYLYNGQRIELNENDKLVEYSSMTSEHLMPKDAKKWIDAGIVSQENHVKFNQKIGNFALLESKLNTKISNSLFSNKVIELKKYTHIKLDYTLCKTGEVGFNVLNEEVWNHKAIELRTDYLAELAGEIWCK